VITFLLAISVLGWFAKFAQNEYGETLIAVSYLFVAILINAMAFKALKIWTLRIVYVFSFLIFLPYLLFLLPLQIDFTFQDYFFSIIAITTLLLCIIFPFLLLIFSFFKKIETDAFAFAEYVFLALIALGFFAKYNHLAGAGIYIIVGSSIFILYSFRGFDLLIKGIGSKQFLLSYDALIYLFCGFFSLAFCFKIQHWQGATILGIIGLFFLGFIIIGFIVKNKEVNLMWWQQRTWIRNYLFIAMALSAMVLTLNSTGNLPEGYSNKFPVAYYEMRSKGNSFTKEGIEYSKKAEIYKEAYFNFIDEQNQKENK
jgi:hypothetical protein